MSKVNQIICDICGKPMFEKSCETGYRLRGATGKKMVLRSFLGLYVEDDVDVCDECWERMKSEARDDNQ
ncbi:hypothetical protein ADLECEL_14420 [Adlercreutzia equolifaciens subsp. celatus]|uniref:Uncharacterized protein n=1 Tax=Adlercreutzia equolifaciens subsp. celatus DSM 18785 TaxID=1121021 RepID=A0A3N0ASV5_9ACTN|nr:hypothetical protein [Adlercreutzia equolifaciens]MCP2077334.1 hypothetical protein [Adlercreutzia equolifaciens subsp. celatus DSM 18785]RFT92557.1 hypothetical protein DX904_06410 [Adlercreutzia equolifaciens subsp. celatus]RNL37933.1 hypothetical protein DMP10_06625 [Adlercreutzia equolifaciens subsp. celatus DSM 18785]BCS57557.1 hypothetical protein ADLECEL_14420 [Adlercreutzia equolifaciens subsp. celatus]